MSDLVFEILTEETPGGLQITTEKDIKQLFIESFLNNSIKYSNITSYSTPRRVAIIVDGLEDIVKDIFIEKKGPAVNSNEKAIKGFLLSNNLSIEDCFIKKTSKGEFYFVNLIIKGDSLINKLPIIIIQDILNKVSFKRSMFWNDSKVKWPRPIRNILCILNDDIVKFNFAGVVSCNVLKGHRFLSKDDFILKNAKDYIESIYNLNVILLSDQEGEEKKSRKEIIINEVIKFSKNNNIIPNLDNNLIKEIIYLVEYPVVLFAEIPDKYLVLPKELLINIMVKNQRYINFFNKDNTISKYFAIVSNIKTKNNEKEIIKGNQKVLNARLEDGIFFYNLDLKTKISERIEKLKKLNFFEGLGSIFDKKERVKLLAKEIFPKEDLNNLIDLYKADLTTEVVKEMPELQGIIGSYYAQKEGFNNEVAMAIKEHYKPQGLNDDLPSTSLGARLSILDKLDNIISFSKINKLPKGSGDQYALRRSALGIIRIIIKYKIDINLQEVINQDVRNFILNRLEFYLKSIGIENNIFRSVILSDKNNFSIYTIYRKSKIIYNNKGIVEVYKRIYNIVENNKEYLIENYFQESKLQTQEEVQLFNRYVDIHHGYEKSIKSKDYDKSIEYILSIKNDVDSFLDKTLIIDIKNKELTLNRINFLKILLDLLQKFAHLENLI